MKLRSDIVTSKVNDEYITLFSGDGAKASNCMIRSNGTAAFILECLKEDVTEEQILGKLKQNYKGDEELMKNDIKNIIKRLTDAGLIS